jgi:hypothetical protein
MAITHSTAIRNALADLVVDAVDVGSADATGDLQIATSSAFTTILATLLFSAPAFGGAVAGVATAAAVTADTNAANNGTAANFRIRDRDNTEVLRGTVTATGGGGDIQLSSTSITAGDTVSLTSLTYTAAP